MHASAVQPGWVMHALIGEHDQVKRDRGERRGNGGTTTTPVHTTHKTKYM